MGYTEEHNRRLKSVQKTLGGICTTLAKDSSETDALLEQILQELQNTPQIESPQFKNFCLDGDLTGSVAYLYNEEDGSIVEIYLDAQGLPTSTRPDGGICPPEIDYEFKIIETDKCLPSGEHVKEVLCITFENGVEVNSSMYWLVGGARVLTNPGAGECVNCDPKIESFDGDAATLTDFNEVTLFIPSCCEVVLTTSAGVISLPKQKTGWVYNQKFDCLLQNYSISSDCVDEIKTILTKSK